MIPYNIFYNKIENIYIFFHNLAPIAHQNLKCCRREINLVMQKLISKASKNVAAEVSIICNQSYYSKLLHIWILSFQMKENQNIINAFLQ